MRPATTVRKCVGRSAALLLVLAVASCSQPAPAPTTRMAPATSDPQHAGITEPHGDHSGHHGGMVLMNGDIHYEIVFDRGGRHSVWFSTSTREDLPATIAANVRMSIARPDQPIEQLALAVDDSGESWVAGGTPVADDAMVKVTYDVKGAPFEVEIPFIIPVAP